MEDVNSKVATDKHVDTEQRTGSQTKEGANPTNDANPHPDNKPGSSVKDEATRIGLPAGFQQSRMKELSKLDNQTFTVEDLHKQQNVFISKCTNCKIMVADVCSKISIESCTNLEVNLTGHLIAGVIEVNKSKDVVLHIHTTVPTVQIDQTENAHVKYDHPQDLEILVTHRCTGIKLTPNAVETYGGDNILIQLSDPKAHKKAVENDDQFITRLVKGQFLTEVVIREAQGGYITTEREVETRERKIEEAITTLSGLMKQVPVGNSGWIS